MNRATGLPLGFALLLGCAGGTADAESFFSMTGSTAEGGSTDTGDEIGTDTSSSDSDTTTGTTTTDDGTDTTTTTTDTTTTDSSTGDPLCNRSLYTYDVDGDSWDAVPLDAVWTGPNAPPCAVEPAAATYVELWDQLLVIGTDGVVYRREGGAWQPPQPIAQVFGVLAGEQVDSAYYVPPINGETSANITISSFPNAVLYRFFEDGTTVYDQTVPIPNEPNGPPQDQFRSRWAATYADPELLGEAGWWQLLVEYENGEVWYADGAFVWQGWPEHQSPFFDGADAPDPSTLEAGWGDFDLRRVYLVGP